MFRLAILVWLSFGIFLNLAVLADTKGIPGLRPDGTYPSPGELVPLVGPKGPSSKGPLSSEVLPTPKPLDSGAMAAVNEARARRGLRPYIEDPALSVGATAAANFRANRGIAGHTSNDFGFLPPGSRASAGGCAAWPVSMGWGSCCAYDNYTYAGAGWAIGQDGRRYMHLFVR